MSRKKEDNSVPVGELRAVWVDDERDARAVLIERGDFNRSLIDGIG